MHTRTRPAHEALAALADAVSTERTLVEALAFRLKALELVLSSDLRRYVSRCLDEVDDASDHAAAAEDRRRQALEELCAAWGRPAATVGLADLAIEAPEPWATVFADHHDHLRALSLEVATTASRNAELATATLVRVDADLDQLTGVLGDAPSTAPTRPPRRREAALRLVPVPSTGPRP